MDPVIFAAISSAGCYLVGFLLGRYSVDLTERRRIKKLTQKIVEERKPFDDSEFWAKYNREAPKRQREWKKRDYARRCHESMSRGDWTWSHGA